MVEIPEVTDLEIAFGGGTDRLLPKWDELPEEYRKGWMGEAPGCRLAEQLFYLGGKLPKPRKGVDVTKASRVIKACLGSFEPKHEHKIAGVGYLLAQWFEV